jgi:hypothetical protein
MYDDRFLLTARKTWIPEVLKELQKKLTTCILWITSSFQENLPFQWGRIVGICKRGCNVSFKLIAVEKEK